MSNIVAPPEKSKETVKPVKQSRTFLADTLSAKMRQTVFTDSGEMTVAQAMTERLANIAMFAESNTDAIAAQKLIYERLYGKAAVQKDDDVKPMPKVIFTLNEDGIKKVDESITKVIQEDNESDESVIIAEIDGKVFAG